MGYWLPELVSVSHFTPREKREKLTNSNSMLSPNRRSLTKQRIPHPGLNLLDLLNRLLLSQPVQEQINIRSRRELLMIELAHQPLGAAVLLGNRQDAVDHRGTRSNDIIPVQLNQRRLGKNIKILPKLLVRLDNSGRLIGTAHFLGKGHDVARPLLFGLGVDVAGADLDGGGVVGEERQDVDVGVLEQLRVRLLGVGLAKTVFIVTVGLDELDQGSLRVVGDVRGQVAVGDRQLGEGCRHGVGELEVS